MPSMMVVVSKKVFAQQAGQSGPGEVLPLERSRRCRSPA
jgi:hypothetical protein